MRVDENGFIWLVLFQNQDKWKYNGPMNSSTISAIGGGISMQSSQQQSHHQMPPNTIGKQSLPQMLNQQMHQQMQGQQDRSRQPTVSKLNYPLFIISLTSNLLLISIKFETFHSFSFRSINYRII